MISRRSDLPLTESCNVGYVVSIYPAVSHAFVLREVLGIRKAGGVVRTFSVHRPEAADLLSAADRSEAASTTSVLPIGIARLLIEHVRAFWIQPRSYLRTLYFALRQRPLGLRSTLWQLFYFAEAILLWSAARRQDVQHLHAHLTNVAADICWLAVVFANGGEKDGVWRWSMTVHGPTEFSAVDQFNLARKVDAADLVVCISDYCRSQLMAISPPAAWQKLVVVHCGVDLARYPYRPPRVGTGPLRVLAVGRLVPEKGQALLIEAVASLVEAGLPITVTLVGGGDEAEALAAQATRLDPDAHWHRFTGPLGQDELPSVFAAHDVFCLPSFAEGVPVVFMEAMSTGLPVVATRIAGIPELVEDGHTGILVPPGRADVIADALRALAESPDLVADLSTNGRRQVELGFDTDVLARDLVAHFASLEHASRQHHPQW